MECGMQNENPMNEVRDRLQGGNNLGEEIKSDQ
jgi:hypothetical protein